MKTTLEIPDELYREVKAKAALEGKRVTDVVVQGLRLVVEKPKPVLGRVEFPILKKSKRKKPVSPELFQRAEEEMYEDEVKRFVDLMRR